MNLNIGSILNSAQTIGSAISEGTNDTGKATLKDFLYSMTTYGIAIKSNFEVTYNGIIGLQFFIQNITTPGLKTNNGQIYYKGRTVDLPINYEQEHEFTMTVINDGTGFVYTSIRNILISDYKQRRARNDYQMTVRQMGDGQNTSGLAFKMDGVRFTGVSGLDFGHTDNSIQTFTVNCVTQEIDMFYTKTTNDTGVLGAVDDFTNKVNSAINKVTGV